MPSGQPINPPTAPHATIEPMIVIPAPMPDMSGAASRRGGIVRGDRDSLMRQARRPLRRAEHTRRPAYFVTGGKPAE
jgi:hypothetical protein